MDKIQISGIDLDSLSKPKKRTVSTEHQLVALELIATFQDLERDKKAIFFRLAKMNLLVFKEAVRELHALDVDGVFVRDRFTYFLWLYKHVKNKGKK